MEDIIDKMELMLDQRTITGQYIIYVNGSEVKTENYYHRFINDENNILYNISDMIKMGINEIKIKVVANKDSDGIRDPLFLLGNFSVTEKHTLITQYQSAIFNSNFIQGFPYYSGEMTFTQIVTIDKKQLSQNFDISFDFGDTCLDCLEVRLNGISLGVRAFTPYLWECKNEYIQEEENKLEIIRTNTLANMLDGTYFDYNEHRLVNI